MTIVTQNRADAGGGAAVITVCVLIVVSLFGFMGYEVVTHYGDTRACETLGGVLVDIDNKSACIKDFTIIDLEERP